MSEEQIIVIDNEEHKLSELDVSTQANIARVNELRREISTLKMQTNERELLLQAYRFFQNLDRRLFKIKFYILVYCIRISRCN